MDNQNENSHNVMDNQVQGNNALHYGTNFDTALLQLEERLTVRLQKETHMESLPYSMVSTHIE